MDDQGCAGSRVQLRPRRERVAARWARLCVLPDVCPVVATKGTDWCVTMVGALMWPAGQPELAEPVRPEGKLAPDGCRCMNDDDDDTLLGEPSDLRDALIEDVEKEARYACVEAVLDGYESNCFDEQPDPLAPSFGPPNPKDELSEDCIGACVLAGNNCGPDPDPHECNDLVSGETETGEGDDTGRPASESELVIAEEIAR